MKIRKLAISVDKFELCIKKNVIVIYHQQKRVFKK